MDACLNRVVHYLAGQSWQIALLTLVVATITYLLRNRSAHVRYLLWLVVLAKCLVPPWYVVPLDVVPVAPRGAASPVAAWLPSVAERLGEEARTPSDMANAASEGSPQARQVPTVNSHRWSFAAQAGLIWIAGAMVYLTINLLRAVRAEWWFRRKRRPLPEPFRQRIAEMLCMEDAKDKGMPTVWLLDDIGQPFVWGLLRGSIYLPARFLDLDDPHQQRSVLLHELGHVVRCDAVVNLFQVAAQAIFWFHPFVWWASRQIRQEREKCCDEMAIARLGVTPKDYGTAILSTLIQAQESTRSVPSLAVTGPVKNIEERIRAMLKPGKQFHTGPSLAVATILVFAALVAVPTTFTLTARAQAEPTTQKPAGGSLDQPRYAARTFNSKMALTVAVRETPAGDWRSIGRTPSATPIAIPACYMFLGHPSEPVRDWDLLAQEIGQNGVPYLSLRLATDADVKHLAGLTRLQGLDLCNTKITDGGLTHLKGLTGLCELLLCDTRITDIGLEHLKGLTALRQLWLDRTQVTDAGLRHLKGLTKLQELRLEGTSITDAGLMHFTGLTALQNLDLRNTQTTNAGLERLGGLTGLQRLSLSGPAITDVGLEHLKGLTALQHLDLRNTRVTDSGLEHLRGLTALRELWLDRTLITDSGLSHIKGMTALQWLSLSGTQVTDAGLPYVMGLTRLETLYLSSARITDAGLEHLKGLTALQHLDLDNTQVTDAGLASLRGLSGLLRLILDGTPITDSGLEHLKDVTGLQTLSLDNTRVKSDGLAHLKGLTRLQYLYLRNTQITDTGLPHLSGLTELQDLHLNGTQVTDAGLGGLFKDNGLPRLQVLSLSGTQVTDAGLAHLKGLTNLQNLYLSNARITDAGLVNLKGLPTLEWLSLDGTQVTDAGVQRLKQSLPNLVIVRE